MPGQWAARGEMETNRQQITEVLFTCNPRPVGFVSTATLLGEASDNKLLKELTFDLTCDVIGDF